MCPGERNRPLAANDAFELRSILHYLGRASYENRAIGEFVLLRIGK